MTLRLALRPALRQALRPARDPLRTPASQSLSPALDGMLAWWGYGDATGSGGLADAWADRSGNGIHAIGSGDSLPTLTATGTVLFAQGKKLSADTGTVAQPITLCLRMRVAGSIIRFFGAQEGACIYLDNGTIRLNADADVNSTVPHPVDEFFSMVAVFNGAASAVYVTGDSATGLNPGTAGIASNGLSFNDPSFYQGGAWECAEGIAYAGALDAVPADVVQTLAYLDSINPA